MALSDSLASCSTKVYQTISSFLETQEKQALKVDPLVGRSVSILKDFSLRGGKAVRPYLTLTGFLLAGEKPEEGLYNALAAVELHHKHILILDDIADRDETRYGGKTVEHVYRNIFKDLPEADHRAFSFAMLDGVLLGALSKELLFSSGFDAPILIEVMHVFDTVMYRDTLAGWQIHGVQAAKNIEETTAEEFIKGLELVTARYTFEGPLRIGLILAGNTDKVLESALVSYAKYVGTAFQIYDDILGLFGESKKTGKPVGNDVREGKKTLLLQEAYKNAKKEEKEFLQSVIGREFSKENLERIQTIVRSTGSLSYSQALAQAYVEKGIQALSPLVDSKSKQHLIELAHFVIAREK